MGWNIVSGNGQDMSEGIEMEHVARKVAQEHANRIGESVYLYDAGPSDSEAEAEEEEEIRPHDGPCVVLETMPDEHRASHRRAGNWGAYPRNGATRIVMPLDDALECVAADVDGYTHIVEEDA